ncbi:metal-sulfur cluster assembly factor [Enterococcus olivae]
MREDIKIDDRALAISDKIIEKLQMINDPEIGLDIYNLGFIYEISLAENGHCEIVITFTGIGCECLESVPGEIETALKEIDEISEVEVKIVWTPAWKMTRISRFGRIALGINPN